MNYNYKSKKPSVARFIAFIFKRHYLTKDLLCICLAILINITAALANPLLFKQLFDRVLPSEEWTSFIILSTVIISLFLINSASILMQNNFSVRISDKVINRLRIQLLHRVINVSREENDKNQSGSILTRFTEDISFLEQSIVYSLFTVIKNFVFAVSAIFLLVYLNVYLVLVVLFFIPLTFKLSNSYLKKSHEYDLILKKNKNDLVSYEHEIVLMRDLIKLLKLKNYKRKIYKNLIKKYSLFKRAYNIKLGLASNTSMLGANLITILVLVIGVAMVMLKYFTIGEVIAFLVLLGYFKTSISFLSSQYPMVVKGALSLDHIQTFLSRSSISRRFGVERLGPIRKQIDFMNVAVLNQDREIISSINIHINAGQKIAFIGRSGAGKSTLLKLLIREIPLAAGKIQLDGKNIDDFSNNSLYTEIGMIPQQSKLFKTSIKENIRLGNLNATDDEIIDVAKLAGVHEDILLQPQGYDTQIKEEVALSSGQIQRITVARALIARPSVLCIDEPTSALDPITASAIEQSFLSLPSEMTLIMVTHRLKIMRHIDHIFVFDKGHLVEHGTHQKLLDKNGLYTSLWEKQAGIHLEKDMQHVTIDVQWLKKIPIFSQLDDRILEQLSAQFLVEKVEPQTTIVEEGTLGNVFYIIASGVIDVSSLDQKNKVIRKIAVLSDGDYFGEISLLFNIPRVASLVTRGICVLLTLRREQAEKIFNKLPEDVRELLISTAKKRIHKNINFN